MMVLMAVNSSNNCLGVTANRLLLVGGPQASALFFHYR